MKTKEPTMAELNPLDASSWDCCDEHETTFMRDSYCKECRIEKLEQDDHAAQHDIEQLIDGNNELLKQLELADEINKSLRSSQTQAHINDLEDTNEALTRELGKASKAADKLEQGIQNYIDGDEPKYKPKVDCEHGTPHWEDCGQCTEDYFSGLLKGARDE